MLHLGLVKPRLRGNTPQYYSLVKSVMVITTIDTVILGTVSFLVNLASGNAEPGQVLIYLCVPTIACMLAVGLSIPLTSLIAIETYRRGLDPDILVYPILASMNDIIVTVFFVATIFTVLRGGVYFTVLLLVFVSLLAGSVYVASLNWNEREFKQTLREGTFIVVASSLFGSFNGVLLSRLGGTMKTFPGLMAMYPALTNALGNIGSIIGSKSTTNMALGIVRSLRDELRETMKTIVQVEAPAALVHVLFACLSYLLTRGGAPGASLGFLVAVALGTNLLSFTVITVFALLAAHQAFHRGLNPDNVVIPAITSVSDTTATLALTPALIIARMLIGN